jgi:hypothetical protein
MYDSAGNPVWYSSAGRFAEPTSYSGTLMQFASGQPIVGPYRPPAAPVSVGTIAIEFSAPDRAEMTLSDGGASNAVTLKRSRSGPITPTLPPTPIVLPDTWQGLFSQVVTKELQIPLASAQTTWTITGETVIWAKADPADPQSLYKPSGELRLRVSGTEEDPAQTCTHGGEASLPLSAADGELHVNPQTGVYRLRLSESITYLFISACTSKIDRTTTIHRLIVDEPLEINGSGNVIDRRIRGHPKQIDFPAGVAITTTHFWYFVAVP